MWLGKYEGTRFCNRKCYLNYRERKIKKKDCAYCGERIDNWRKYCSQKCFGMGIRKKPVIIYCEICGKFIEKTSKYYKKKFCSGVCRGKGHIKKYGRKIKCEYCNREFHPVNKTIRFCSRVCYENTRTTELKCLECKKKFRIRNFLANNGRTFCSRKCSMKYQNDRGLWKRAQEKSSKVLRKKLLGKTYEELHGKKKAKEMKENHSKRMKEKFSTIWAGDNNPLQTSEARRKSAESRRGMKVSEETKKKLSEKQKYLLRNNKIKRRQTKPELEMQEILQKMKVKFERSWWIPKIEEAYPADFYLPKHHCVIECDGKYWHNYPIGNGKDHRRTKQMLEAGYKVLRFWEGEITEDAVRSGLASVGIEC